MLHGHAWPCNHMFHMTDLSRYFPFPLSLPIPPFLILSIPDSFPAADYQLCLAMAKGLQLDFVMRP